VSAISTHVLDTATGRPAAGMRVRLERLSADGDHEVASATTDANGRVAGLGPEQISAGTYRLVFDTGGYLARQRGDSGTATEEDAVFFPEVTVTFSVGGRAEHYHVPLLMSPFGYSTYRGS
jgi:5-hydroxyisourate hydrolase